MGWFLAAMFCFFIAYLCSNSIEKENKTENITIRDVSAVYIGGFSDIKGGEKSHIKVKQHEIEIMFGGVVINGKKIVPMNMVTNAEIKSESQITQEVSLGKMIVFGAFAFAMQNSKSTVKNYLVISCNDNGNKRDLVFESYIAEKVVKEIRRIKGIKSIF